MIRILIAHVKNDSGYEQISGETMRKAPNRITICGVLALFTATQLSEGVLAQGEPRLTEEQQGKGHAVLEDGPTRPYVEKYVSANWSDLRRTYANGPEFVLDIETTMERKAMRDAMSAGDFQKAVSLAKAMLDRNYVDIDTNVLCDLAYQKLSKPELARRHRIIWVSLVQSIIGANDGRSPEKAFEAINVSEERVVLDALRLKPLNRALVHQANHSYDVWSASDRNGEVMKIFFQIDGMMRAEDKFFSQNPPTTRR